MYVISTARYQEFGEWIEGCFGRSVATTQGSGFHLELSGVSQAPMLLDHVLISEDQSQGQSVLEFSVSAILPNSSLITLLQGQSIGNKFIRPVTAINASKVVLDVSEALTIPTFLQFSVHNCNHEQ